VPAPSASLAATGEAVPTLAPMLPEPGVVQRFIDQGVANKDDNHALVLRDSQQGWTNLAMAMATPKYLGPGRMKTALWIEVFTPLSWVTQTAAAATREYRKFTLTNVTPELMEPVVRVMVHPDVPAYLTAAGKVGTRSVQHVDAG
jgi:hypothetical protein